METENKATFDQWCILELFGHTRLAGHVTEASIGGGSFIRVDVPDESGETFLFTRYYGPTAIYSMSPVSKEVAVAVASKVAQPPVHTWELPKQLTGAVDVPAAARAFDYGDDGDEADDEY